MKFSPVPTGEIAKNLYAVKTGIVNLFVYTDGKNAICIDAGESKIKLEKEFEKININPDSISHLFLTHSDYDHTAGISLLSNTKTYMSSFEEQMINGTTPRAFLLRFNSKIERGYTMLADGDIINIGKIKVTGISTPGHTLGSMSYLVNDTMLFSGDTLTLKNDIVHPFGWFQNMDTGTQKKSIRKLARLNGISILCTAHTGYTKNFESAISKWR